MKISIITATYNSEKTIEESINSVLNQSYDNIEYIIIDGGSTDKTIDIISNYLNKISVFISEKDKGIYDAMNKGILISKGDLIGFLHSDDIFAKSNIIKDIINTINISKTDSIYGDLFYVRKDNTNKIIRKWQAGDYQRKKLLFGWMPPHPTFFVKKKIYEKHGLYDLSFGSAADYELIVRYMYKYNISSVYFQKVITLMRVGGKSNKSIINRIKAHINDWRAWVYNGITIFPFWVILKPIRKLNQYIIK